MIDSTLWIDREAREIFITALLMAQPMEIREPAKQIEVESLEYTGFEAPVGWYGFVAAASTGIINRCGISREAGMAALIRLGEPEAESRTPDHEGRRMIRIDGGFLILNYDKYRRKDHTAAERTRRYRARTMSRVTLSPLRVTGRSVTQAEAEAEAEAENTTPIVPKGTRKVKDVTYSQDFETFWKAYPRKTAKGAAWAIWTKTARPGTGQLLEAIQAQSTSDQWTKDGGQYIPHPATWLNQRRWEDEAKTSTPQPYRVTAANYQD
jgi:hypothetical protein